MDAFWARASKEFVRIRAAASFGRRVSFKENLKNWGAPHTRPHGAPDLACAVPVEKFYEGLLGGLTLDLTRIFFNAAR